MNIEIESVKDGVTLLRLNRPEVLNAFNLATRNDLSSALSQLDRDSDVRCIVITGAGDRAFSTGADLKEESHRTEGGISRLVFERSWTDQLERTAEMGTPTVAAIRGYCVAGGLEIALACDIRIASDDAVFFAPELRWGLLHAYGARRLAAVVGLGRATHMLLTGQRVDAQEAFAAGLVTQVVPPERVVEEAVALATHVAALPLQAVRITRELLRAGAGGMEATVAARLAIAAAAAGGENVGLVPEFGRSTGSE